MLCGLALSLFIISRSASRLRSALAIGLPLALSSTAQVLPMLRSDNELNTPQGERAFSILLFQDLSIVPMITIIAAMSRAPPDPDAPTGWMLALYTVAARSSALVLVGRLVLNPLFRLVGRFGERELFVVAGLFTVIGASALMHTLHLSIALGAFIAGVMLAESPYRHELESDVEPFRSILLGLFFLSVGMLLDLDAIAARPLFVIGIAAGGDRRSRRMLIGRAGAAVRQQLAAQRPARPAAQPGGRIRLRPVRPGRGGAADHARGGVAVRRGRDPVDGRDAVPDAADRLARAARGDAAATGSTGPRISPETNAIVVGYGRFGQTVAQMLRPSASA